MTRLKTIRNYAIAIFLGMILSALILDNRAGAMLKAFVNPQAVNGITFEVQVSKK